MTIRVMVHATVSAPNAKAFQAEYQSVSHKVKGTPGHIKDELLHDAEGSGAYILLSEWESEAQFRAWEDAPIHRQTTGGMRPYWDGDIKRVIYEVTLGG